MTLSFIIPALVLVLSAIGAMSLRNLVHCALCLTVTFASLAVLYLQLGAQYVGLAQILVYVGAVAILIVFAILLTRNGGQPAGSRGTSSWWIGLVIAVVVFGTMAYAILSSGTIRRELKAEPVVTVKQIGHALMTDYVLPLEAIALLLTAAMIGAVIIAMQERPDVATKSDKGAGEHAAPDTHHPHS